jgi:hypothetical protein
MKSLPATLARVLASLSDSRKHESDAPRVRRTTLAALGRPAAQDETTAQSPPGYSPRILAGWVRRGFILATFAPLLVVTALLRTYPQDPDPVAASGWIAASVGFAAFLYFAGTLAPTELQHIRDRNILGEAYDYDYTALYRRIERDAHSPWSLVLSLLAGVPVGVGYVFALGGIQAFIEEGVRPPDGSDGWQLAELLEVSVGTFLAALAGLGLWRMAVLGWHVHRIGSDPALRIQLGHPDRCGGLAPLGHLCLWNGFIVAVPGALLGFWIAAAQLGFEGTNVAVHVVLALMIVGVGLLAFALPLYRVHKRMEGEAAPLLAAMEVEARAIHQLTRELIVETSLVPARKRAKKAKQLKLRRRLYSRYQGIPTWPIRAREAAKFAAAQVPATFGIVTGVAGFLRP